MKPAGLPPDAQQGALPGAPDPDADLLVRIRQLEPGLSQVNQRLARLILADPASAMQSNVDEIAAAAEVGKPTVVRFARLVGCDGLKDLKLKLAASLALGANYLHRAVQARDSDAEVINNVIGSSLSAVAQWHRGIDASAFARAASALDKAGRIDCFGTGQTSNFMALDLQARLFRLGLHATASSDAYLQLVAAATLSPGDAVVAISFVGRMPFLLEAVAEARKRKATVIAVTRAGTPLAEQADIVLPVDVPADAMMLVGTDAYITQLLTIEILTILLGRLRAPHSHERLETLHRLLRAKDRAADESADVYWDWSDPSADGGGAA